MRTHLNDLDRLPAETTILTAATPARRTKLLEWVRQQSCAAGFDLLMRSVAIGPSAQVGWIGTPLHRLASPAARLALQQWAEDRPAFGKLAALADGLAISGAAVLRLHPPLPTQIPAKRQFHGQLERYHVLALLVSELAKLPGTHDAEMDQLWFSQLQLWVLVHAAVRVEEFGTQFDAHLESVCRFLRQVAEGHPVWSQLAAQLRGPLAETFTGINHQLARRAQLLRNAESSPTARHYLAAILSVCKFEVVPAHPLSEDDTTLQIRQEAGEPYPAARERRWLPTGEEQDRFLTIISDEESGEQSPQTLLALAVEPDVVVRQRSTARSVLLTTREQSQFLPWSWEQPLPDEHRAIQEWIVTAKGLVVTDPRRILAALVWLALTTHRSLNQTLELEIRATPSPDWAVDETLQALLRTPPRPQNGWQPADVIQQSLIHPLAAAHHIALPDWIDATLRAGLTGASTGSMIGSLWPQDEPSVNEAFRDIAVKTGFPRVQPYMLARWMPMNLFSHGADAILAAGATARPNAGLPGAHAYASWPANELACSYQHNGFALSVLPENSPACNALGSRLTPLEGALGPAVVKIIDRLTSQQSSPHLVERHNAYVSQLVLYLLIATGARPISDPFESFSHFNLDDSYVFVADKIVGSVQRGRLVPIPQKLCVHLRQNYANYLRSLATHLQAERPALSAAIASACNPLGHSQGTLPLFFLLSEDASAWLSVSETAIKAIVGTFPLPLNCFRHRVAQSLRRIGTDSELIDAILGHAQAGTATHGDYSMRRWNADMMQIRAPLDQLYSALALPLPDSPELSEVPSLHSARSEQLIRPFGLEARLIAQRNRQRAARQQARQIIERSLNRRALDALSAEEIDSLERRLLFTERGLPHPAAAIRYGFYLRLTEQTERSRRLVKRRRFYQPLLDEIPFFTPVAPRACHKRNKLSHLLDELSRGIPPSRAATADARLLAALHLAVESRVSNPQLLEGIGRPDQVRLMFHRRRYWIEFRPQHCRGNDTDETDGWERASVVRLPISRRGAAYLVRAQETDPRRESTGVACTLNQALGIEPPAAAPTELLRHLTEVIDQANAIELPGVLAGFLAGRVTSYSLGWTDRVRLDTGQLLDLPVVEDDEFPIDAPLRFQVEEALETPDQETLRERTRQFFAAIRAALAQCSAGRRSNARRDLVRAIAAIVDEYASQVSSAVLMVGQWTANLAATVNRISSVERYLSGVSGAVETVWYDADLAGADEFELTERYQQLLEARPMRDLAYVGQLLRRFHRFARRTFGIATPWWDELGIPARGDMVSPGLILEQDYLTALSALERANLAPETRGAAQAVLLFCYRFGLRVGEAFGLLRCDWIEHGTTTYVLVQNNKLRKLKRSSSRRIVPLLFPLDQVERDILTRALSRHLAQHGGSDDTALLGDIGQDQTLQRMVQAEILAALRVATGNPETTLHHARHSFAMRAFVSVAAIHGYHAPNAQLSPANDLGRSILGYDHPTRRALWAVTRLLGHAAPQTTLTSYVHCLDDWVDQIVMPAVRRRVGVPSLPCANLDTVPRRRRSRRILQPAQVAHRPDMLELLQLARLVAQGYPVVVAESQLQLIPDSGRGFVDALACLSRIKQQGQNPMSPAVALRRTITSDQWAGLYEAAKCWYSAAINSHLDNLTVGDVIPLIGRTRQILMTAEPHFALVRQFIGSFGIAPNRYRVTVTDIRQQELIDLANSYGFCVTPRDELSKKSTPFEVDPLSLLAAA